MTISLLWNLLLEIANKHTKKSNFCTVGLLTDPDCLTC